MMSEPGSTEVFVYGETGADNIIQVPYLPTPGTGGAASFRIPIMLAVWGRM